MRVFENMPGPDSKNPSRCSGADFKDARGENMEEKQKRKLSETGYPGRDIPAKSNAVDAQPTPGRHAEAVKKHIALRKGQ